MATFIAKGIVRRFSDRMSNQSATNALHTIRILDPSVGDGALLIPLLEQLGQLTSGDIRLTAFDTDATALNTTRDHIKKMFPQHDVDFRNEDFLRYAINARDQFDVIIANPPYVRTQVLGAETAGQLATEFGLKGRVDLSFAFLISIARILDKQGVAGIVTSNRFMTTKAGAIVRRELLQSVRLRHILDLGDTRMFDSAAVLPAILFFEGSECRTPENSARYTSVYQSMASSASPLTSQRCTTVLDACLMSGDVQLDDGRVVTVQQGTLANEESDDSGEAVWRLSNPANDQWLSRVLQRTWRTWGDVFSIRVGVKTCADQVFIRNDWNDVSPRPELLQPLTTHHIAGNYQAAGPPTKSILYPYDLKNEQRTPIQLSEHMADAAYLESHRDRLSARKYVLDAGRKWFEIWVPHSPTSWANDKIVFRDIADLPQFWMDRQGTIVNGDCYWMLPRASEHEELLWLAMAIGNSTFVTQFYDRCFNNRLYAGRRRFITQYVEKFPLPDPGLDSSRELIRLSQEAYQSDEQSRRSIAADISELVAASFGVE